MRYELTDLRVFLAIAQAKSLSAGAAEMHLTAPSASYRLKNLSRPWVHRCLKERPKAWC
jgi:DNA-binding transcriptional LysR family regulator